MSGDLELQDRMLELIFGLLPEEEAVELRGEIADNPRLAEAYAEAESIAGLMAEAAKLKTSPIPLTLPEPNDREVKPKTQPPSSRPEPAPWSRWAHWGLTVAAGLLVALTLVGWTQQRSRVADAGGDQLRLQVTGPSRIQASVENRYSISTTTAAGRPMAANVHFAVYTPEGERLLAHTERTDADGRLRVVIPDNLELPRRIRLKFDVHEGKLRHRAESPIPVRHEPLSTHLSTDRSYYQPGETVRFRSVSLSRYHLEPGAKLPVKFELVDPLGIPVATSEQTALTRRGVAAGEFLIPEDACGGVYTLFARSAEGAFVEVDRELRIEPRRTSRLRTDVEFAGVRYTPGMDVAAALRILRRDGSPVSSAKVRLRARVDGETIHEETVTSDARGGVAARFRLPSSAKMKDAVLIASIDDGAVRESIVEPIPLSHGKIFVDFFPEGGDLAAVGENRIYFAARDSAGEPVELTGWIVDDNGGYHAAVTTTHEGRGVFRLAPRRDTRYHLMLADAGDVEIDAFLPPVSPARKLVVNTGTGVFSPGEPIEFNVRASEPGLPLVAMAACRGVHVGEQVFLTKPPEENGTGTAANAVAIELPKEVAGVIRLTVFDYGVSPPRPVAERLVYRRPAHRLEVSVAANRESYGPGDPCQLAVKVTDERGRATESILGLSVVDESALAPTGEGPAAMTTHFWLTSQIENAEQLEDADFLLKETIEAETALDLLLGTQGWRRFVERSTADRSDLVLDDAKRGRLVAMHSAVSPPLVLDNLGALKDRAAESGASDEASSRVAGVVAALVFLGAAALVLLVVMLSLLRVVGGVRLWTPAVVAVAASLFLALFVLSPDRAAPHAVAFLPYCQPTVLDEDRLELAEEDLTAEEGKETIDALRVKTEVAEELKRKTDARTDRDVDHDATMAEDRKELLEEESKPKRTVAPMLAPADRPTNDEMSRLLEQPPKGVPGVPAAPSLLASEPKPKPEPVLESAAPAEPTSAPMPKKPESLDLNDSVAIPGDVAKKLNDKQSRDRRAGDALRGMSELRGGEAVSRRHRPADERFDERDSAYSYRREFFAYVDAPLDTRGNRAKTVYWAPLLETDPDGTAGAEFTLSDAVTKYRIVANAHGAGRLGATIDTLNSSLPLHIQPTLPEVVTAGDRFSVPLVVGGKAAKGEDLNVEVESTGPIQCGEAKEITVGRDDSPIRWFSIPVEAGTAAGDAAVVFRAGAAGHADAVRKTVSVELPGYPAERSFSGVLDGRKELTFDLPGDVVAGSLEAEFVLLPSPAAGLEWYGDSIKARTFDQTVALMSVSQLLLDYLETHGIADPDLMRAAKRRLTGARKRLDAFNVSARAYSTVEGGPAEVLSTARALLVLLRTSEMLGGEQIAIDRSRGWLFERLDEDRAESLEAEAWALWALAEAGQPDLTPHLSDLAERIDKQDDPRLLAIAILAAERLSERGTVERLRGSLPEPIGDENVEEWGWIERPMYSDRATGAVPWFRTISPAGGLGMGRDSTLALLAPTGEQFTRSPATGSGTVVVRRNERLLAENVIAQSNVRPVLLGGLATELREGENSLSLELVGVDRLPYILVVRYHQSERSATAEDCPLELTTEPESLQASEGGTVRLAVRLANVSDRILTQPVAQIGLPAGLELSTSVLDDMKKSGRIAAYEIAPRRVTLYWQSLDAKAVIELDLELSAALSGSFTGPASSAWLQHDRQTRCWAEPLVIEVVEQE